MINTQHIEQMLRKRYPDLESVGHGVFRGIDRFDSRDYAIRYFDLNDQLASTVSSLKQYQEKVLSKMYFSPQVATDLRWNHYLYFITSTEQASQGEFSRFKAVIEADREYARKQVVPEGDVPQLLATKDPAKTVGSMPVDLATTWSQVLEQHGLGFILDEDITVPDAVRRIVAGKKDKAAKPVSPMALLPSEAAATTRFLKHLNINGFRPHPELKAHPLGRVNLIMGSNGVGKTSLLEAIEFAYCGRNRRSSAILNQTSIIMELEGASEKLVSTTDAARLRARHSNWYAKTEVRTVTIQDSFGKFNFLDTDAAVKLSLSSSSNQIGADVTRLVLGAAAENLADRLRRVLVQLQEELKNLRRDTSLHRQLKLAAQNRVQSIKDMPKLSDSLFLQLLSALRQFGWTTAPENKDGIDALRDNLQVLNTSIGLLQQSTVNVLHSDPKSALRFLEKLNEDGEKANTLNERNRIAKLQQAKEKRGTSIATRQIAAIDGLISYAQTNFTQITAKAKERYNNIRMREAKITLAGENVHKHAVEHLLDIPIDDAVSFTKAQIEEFQHRLITAQSSLQALEKTQNSLTVFRQRLLSTAQDILKRVQNPDHCPLCHSEFENGQLLVRMMADVEGNSSEQAGLLQAEISILSQSLTVAQTAQLSLLPLRAFTGEEVQQVTVGDALAQLNQDIALLEKERLVLQMVQNQVEQLQATGLSIEDMSEKLLASDLAALPPINELQAIQNSRKEELANSQNATKLAMQELTDVQRECEALATRLSFDISDNAEVLVIKISKQISDMEAALGARQILSSLLTINPEMTIEEIALHVASSQEIIAQVATAVAQETANSIAYEKETNSVTGLTAKIEGGEKKIELAAEAEEILEDLSHQSSGGALTNQILAENVQEIASTFNKIHMPNEFDLKIENGALIIIRRKSGAKVELDQMSTGQRAAFALSLFLAMNGRLRTGPPLLLFDDPVAHIDDINVLSFLDHLRHIAINGSRQIFFATADTKLAGLFRHKFRFLGDEFKELSLSRD